MPHVSANAGVYQPDEFERLFLAADYTRCREMLARAPACDATALQRARLDLRDGSALDVVERLSSLRPAASRARTERDILLGIAFSQTGDSGSAFRLYDRALARIDPADELYCYALFQKALATWAERDFDSLALLVTPLLRSSYPFHRGRGRILRGLTHAQNRDLPAQAAENMKALDEFETMAQPDMLVWLSTIFTLAGLSRELPLEDVFERVRSAYENMRPTSGMQLQYFKLTRIIGWIEALHGNELAAFRYFRTAGELAPTPHWRVLCITDRAYLAQTTGERAFAMDQLYGAHELASALSWNDAREEDRITLLSLAELFAAVDPAVAQRYLALFRSLRTPMDTKMNFYSDSRVPAIGDYTAGMALLRLGEMKEAQTALMRAWETFHEFDYGWRAARCALALHKVTRDPRWITQARTHAAPWPNSWIAREVRQAREAQIQALDLDAVSPAQRHVLDLVLEGKRNAEIAAVLDRSPNTIRNHIAVIFKVFGVRSRSELIARLGPHKK